MQGAPTQLRWVGHAPHNVGHAQLACGSLLSVVESSLRRTDSPGGGYAPHVLSHVAPRRLGANGCESCRAHHFSLPLPIQRPFSDFLEMAQHLSNEGYKDAAAVIAGSSLEAHLKRLCEANSVELEATNSKGELVARKADVLNADLVKTAIYDKTEQKQVTAWLGVRNDAAHGDYERVIKEVVGAMIHGIRMFIGRYPA